MNREELQREVDIVVVHPLSRKQDVGRIMYLIDQYTAAKVKEQTSQIWNWLLFDDSYYTDLTAIKITRTRDKFGNRKISLTVPVDKEHVFESLTTQRKEKRNE